MPPVASGVRRFGSRPRTLTLCSAPVAAAGWIGWPAWFTVGATLSAFPFTTTSWYFLDAIDTVAEADTKVVVALGDSITDGTASTLNGDDRWPNVLSRRLHAVYGDRVSVVNAGIGGNQITGPTEYSAEKPFAGGPSTSQRIGRDLLSLSGVTQRASHWFDQ